MRTWFGDEMLSVVIKSRLIKLFCVTFNLSDSEVISDVDSTSASVSTATGALEASMSTASIGVIAEVSLVSILLLSVAIFTIWKFCHKTPGPMDVEDNPTYGG